MCVCVCVCVIHQQLAARDGVVNGTEDARALLVHLGTPDGTVDVDPLSHPAWEESPRPLVEGTREDTCRRTRTYYACMHFTF